jgi:hypothetical protein
MDHAEKPEYQIMKHVLLAISIPFFASVPPNVYGTTLGRLFFTPEQRRQMDNMEFEHDKSGTRIQSLTVNGIVQKHGGKRTVWINGVPQIAGKSDEQAPASYPLDVPGVNKPVRVKVGQKVTVDAVAGKE